MFPNPNPIPNGSNDFPTNDLLDAQKMYPNAPINPKYTKCPNYMLELVLEASNIQVFQLGLNSSK